MAADGKEGLSGAQCDWTIPKSCMLQGTGIARIALLDVICDWALPESCMTLISVDTFGLQYRSPCALLRRPGGGSACSTSFSLLRLGDLPTVPSPPTRANSTSSILFTSNSFLPCG